MILIELHNKQHKFETKEEFNAFLLRNNLEVNDDGSIVEISGVGVIPEILNRWFAERVEYKNLMKKYKNEGNAELAEFYDRRQHIQKIFLNSLYGVLGLPIFRFFDIDNALAVTASGQDVIKKSAEFVNELYWSKLDEKKDYCTYIDTDSVYFSATPLMPSGADGKQFTIKLARAVEKKLNEYYDQMAQDMFFCKNHRLYIKGESVAETAVWIAKKRYVMNTVYDLESNLDVSNKMKPKGLDVVRSSFPPAFRDFMNKMMKDILHKVPKTEIDKKILEFRDTLKHMSYLEVARNTSVKNISEYQASEEFNQFEKGTPIHVKAALTYNVLLKHFGVDHKYEKISDGDKIKYVYLKKNPWNIEALAIKGYGDPKEISDIVGTYIDYDLLFEKELQSKIEDFYSALRWGNIPTEVNQNADEWFSF